MLKYIHLTETQSTNTYLKELLLEQKVDEGTVVYTDFQTSGKGQKGNTWESERGKNIMFSQVLFPDTILASEQFIISQLVSLAIKDCLSEYTDNITIKWPNDIYWKDKKICGILIENSLMEDKINQSVLGIGINLNQIKFVCNAPNPISLQEITGRKYDIYEFLYTISNRIIFYYEKVKNGQTEAIIDKYKASLFRNNGFFPYHDGEKEFMARIKDVETNGLLILETDKGEVRHFAFKEVRYIL